MIIRIAQLSSEPGWAYDVWANIDEGEDITDIDPDDGGICTSDDITVALDAAHATALDLIINNNP